MLMLTLDVLRRIHEDVFLILPRQLAEVDRQLRMPASGWAPWDARSALQWQQHQVRSVSVQDSRRLLSGGSATSVILRDVHPPMHLSLAGPLACAAVPWWVSGSY